MKTVLITGATSGIGLGCARRFARGGYRLILTGRKPIILQSLKEELEQQYNVMAGAAMQHSAKYDTDGFKGGGMHPKAK